MKLNHIFTFFLLFCFIVLQVQATSYAELRSVLLQNHDQLLTEKEFNLEQCRIIEEQKQANATTYWNNIIKSIKNEISNQKATIQSKKEQIRVEEERISSSQFLVGNEVELIEKLKIQVNNLESDMKQEILDLLDAIMERVLGESYKRERYRMKYHKYIAPLQVNLDTALSILEQKKMELQATEKQYSHLYDRYLNKKYECDQLEDDNNDWLELIRNQYDAILDATKPAILPDGRKIVVGQALGDGFVRTFDGLNYTIPNHGSYILTQVAGETLRVEGLYRSRNTSKDESSAVVLTDVMLRFRMYPLSDVSIWIDSHSTVFVNDNEVSLPYSSGRLYISKSVIDQSIYIDLPSESTVRVIPYDHSIAKDVYVSISRDNYFGSTVGLLGIFDDYHVNDLSEPDGKIITDSDGIEAFVSSWDTAYYSYSIFSPSFLSEAFTVENLSSSLSALHFDRAKATYLTFSRSENLIGNGVRCRSIGDPSYITFDGYRRVVSVVGDYYLAQTVTRDLIIQTRSKPFGSGSVNTDVAMIINDDKVLVSSDATIKINGDNEIIPDGGFSLPNGGFITFSNGKIQVAWPNGAVLIVSFSDGSVRRFQNVWLYVPHRLLDRISEGMCGSFDINKDNDPALMGSASRVAGSSLFDEYYQPPSNWVSPLEVGPDHDKYPRAKEICLNEQLTGDDLESCIQDIILSGDDKFKYHYRDVVDIEKQINETLIFLEPVVHLTFDKNMEQDPIISGQDGAYVDISNSHLVLPELNSTARVKLDHVLESGQISIGFWVEISSVNDGRLVQHVNEQNGNTIWYIGLEGENTSPNHINIVFVNGITTSRVMIPKRRWTHVVIVCDGQNIFYYVDRIMIHSERFQLSFPVIDSGSNLKFGQGTFTARLKDFRIYEAVLLPLNVEQLYMDRFRTYLKQRTVIYKFIQIMESKLGVIATERLNRLSEILLGKINTAADSIRTEEEILQDLEYYLNRKESQLHHTIDHQTMLYNNKTYLVQLNKTIHEDCIEVDKKTITNLDPEVALLDQIINLVKEHKDLRRENDNEIHNESFEILQLLMKIRDRIKSHIEDTKTKSSECKENIADISAQIEAIIQEKIVVSNNISQLEERVDETNASLFEIERRLKEYQNEHQNLVDNLDHLQFDHMNWVEEQERIINKARALLEEDYSKWMDAGSLIPSNMTYYTHSDSVTALNVFEHLGIDNPWDYIPILSRVKGSHSGLKSKTLTTAFTSTFSVALDTEVWNVMRSSVKHLLVIACDDNRCNHLRSGVLIDLTQEEEICQNLPMDLNYPSLLRVSQSCEDSSSGGILLGSKYDLTYFQPGSTKSALRYWGIPGSTVAKRIIVLGTVKETILRQLTVSEANSGVELKRNIGEFSFVFYPPDKNIRLEISGPNGYSHVQNADNHVDLFSGPIGTYSVKPILMVSTPHYTAPTVTVTKTETGVSPDTVPSSFTSVVHLITHSDKPLTEADVEYIIGGTVIKTRSDDTGRTRLILPSGTATLKVMRDGFQIINSYVAIPEPPSFPSLDDAVDNKPVYIQTK